MSYTSFSNPFSYILQDGSGGSLDLTCDTIVGGKTAEGVMSNRASIPMTVPPVYPIDDVETNLNSRNGVHGKFDHSSNTFIIDPTIPRDKNGFPGQHARLTYTVVWWISKTPGGAPFLPGANYFVRKANTVYYNDVKLIQDDLWATDSYTGMPSNQRFNGNSARVGDLILGQTAADKSEVRFFNLALVRNNSTTFSNYTPESGGSILNSLPGTSTFQSYIPPSTEAYWSSTRWMIYMQFPRSTTGTYSKIPGT